MINTLIVVSPDGKIKTLNAATCNLLGYKESELLGQPFGMVIADEEVFKGTRLQELVEKGSITNIDMTYRSKSGDQIPVLFSGSAMRDDSSKLTGIVCMAQDISDRKHAEEELKKRTAELEASNKELKESEAKYHDLYENAPDMYVSVHPKTSEIIQCNKTLATNLGYTKEEIIGQPIFFAYHPDSMEDVKKAFNSFVTAGSVINVELELKRKDGSKIPVVLSVEAIRDKQGNILHSRSAWRDITNRKRAEEEREALRAQVIQSKKLESIGTLAGGVAHEINNPINGIMNYAQLISDRLDPESPLREFADEIGHETERVAEIVRNLLAFARQEKESHSPARIVDIVNDTISLIRTIILRDQITLKVDVPDGLPKIKCRSQQIQQVLMNFLTNARDALNERYPDYDPDKIMTVTVRPFEKEGRQWVRTTVEDHGAGIPDEIRGRLFDPFFTTKDRSKGTGLGLSISHGIVQDHRGELSVECEAGRYTRFHFDLPVDNGWELK